MSKFSYLYFVNTEKNGRLDAVVIEPTELSIGRACKVPWKKEYKLKQFSMNEINIVLKKC